ncbi:extracellular solute-binding protein [Sporolactobacillus sp. THM7-7]|nr:extracellular solute-binding protein [Sporolactobacillus sp. THM7-7]
MSLDGSTGQNIISLAQSLQPTLDNDGFDYQKGKYNYSSPNVIKAIEFLLKLRDAGVIHPNSTNASGTDIQGLFANKKIVFNISGLPFVRVNKFELGDVKKYDATQVPVPEAGVKSRQLGLTADSSTSSYITATTKHKKEAGLLIDWISSKEYYQKQLSEDLLLSPITDQNNDIPDPILKNVSEVYKETVIERPIPESNKGALEAKKIESTLPAPSVGFGQIVQGAYIGKLKNWKDELVELDDALNKRLEEAINKAKANGESVSQDQFTFPDFDGQSDYKNE